MFTYPMRHASRRLEYNEFMVKDMRPMYDHVIDLRKTDMGENVTPDEALEGKGTLVLDNKLKKVYCALSDRACRKTANVFLKKLNQFASKPYKLVTMQGIEPVKNKTIYHTDVMFGLLDRHALVYLDGIRN